MCVQVRPTVRSSYGENITVECERVYQAKSFEAVVLRAGYARSCSCYIQQNPTFNNKSPSRRQTKEQPLRDPAMSVVSEPLDLVRLSLDERIVVSGPSPLFTA